MSKGWNAMSLQQMLKEGGKHQQGLEEAVYRNIDACNKLSAITRTSLGPNGMNKMVINHLGKLFVTSDAASIIKQLDVMHPAAKLMVLASQRQEEEVGDGTNWVIVLAGELLSKAKELLKTGLVPSEVAAGYERAGLKALEFLEGLAIDFRPSATKTEDVKAAIRPAVMSKQYGYEDSLAGWIAEACAIVMPKDPKRFNVDNVRVGKIPGGSILDTYVVKGLVIQRDAEGPIKKVANAKLAVFACAIDASKTDTKGTVLIENADQLLNFSAGEEAQMEKIIKDIAASGATVVATGGSIGELAQHYLNRYNLMSVKILSKFELRRLCKATGATALVSLTPPTAEEMGTVDKVEVQELGGSKCVVFQQDVEESAIATIICRGATSNMMEDIERAVDDGVNVVKAMAADNRFVAGAGAVEIELSLRLQQWAETCPGMEQYAIKAFASALESLPRTLAENAGLSANTILADLHAAHAKGNSSVGVDIEGGCVFDAVKEAQIFDLLTTKSWALKYAVEAATTVLLVDQIVMAKPAGGPKPPKMGERDAE